jgi:hypothetical protein
MRHAKLRRSRQRGGVTMLLIVVLIMLAALVGALAVRGAFSEVRMSGSTRVARTSFYCAEAGLNAARPILGASPLQWNTILSTGTTAAFTYPISGSVSGGIGTTNPATGKPDYKVTIVDDADEGPPDVPTVDNNLQVIMVSVCIDPMLSGMTSDMGGRELHELIQYQGNGGTDYRNQAGHSSTHSGNEN